jgi:hypothetical protein
MENKPLYTSIVYRVIFVVASSFLLLVCLTLIISAFIVKESGMSITSIIMTGLIVLFLWRGTVVAFSNYIFSEQKIIIRTPFAGEKECLIEDIIGYKITVYRGTTLILFTKDNKYSVIADGKDLKKAVDDFTGNNREKIIAKNQKELMDKGIFINIDKKRQIHFFDDFLELTINGNKEKFIYKELIPEHLSEDVIKLTTDKHKKINFGIYQCKCQFGLFEYLINYEWKNITREKSNHV